ncbi:hypothetical protein Acr_06g0006730 [Actinidia rufa]|uniref:Uncharacterized protein n=1 Tax=Actinidia rufa TaxID=165716 RepID=A0A7J0EQM7_9ERIC|nr:hypothetical protein Acr_06g0006730 [Actinidia rufa]
MVKVFKTDNIPPPNFELAAIVVKDHIRGSHQAAETGGWGLKFLKKIETRQPVASMETSPSGCCLRNVDDCSTNMNILVPGGFHGGPRNKNDGPSSLIGRWSSGGGCDCGGWDMGCPITVLNMRPTMKEVSSRADVKGDKSFELFIQGSMQGSPPIMKMADIHDGLYLIHFKSTLSALQSFSIAVAIIHTRTPALQPKVYRRWASTTFSYIGKNLMLSANQVQFLLQSLNDSNFNFFFPELCQIVIEIGSFIFSSHVLKNQIQICSFISIDLLTTINTGSIAF